MSDTAPLIKGNTHCRQLPLQNSNCTSLSLRFNDNFPDGPGFSQYQNVSILDFIGAKDDGGGSNNWSCKTCKTPVKSSPPTNQHLAFLQAGCPSRHPTNSVKSTERKTQTVPLSQKTPNIPPLCFQELVYAHTRESEETESP